MKNVNSNVREALYHLRVRAGTKVHNKVSKIHIVDKMMHDMIWDNSNILNFGQRPLQSRSHEER